MNAADYDLTSVVRSWVRDPEVVDTDTILAAVLATVASTPQRRGRWHFAMSRSPLPVAVATAAIVALAAITIGVLPPGGVGGPTPSVSPAASGSPAASDSPRPSVRNGPILGLPPRGVAPSDATPGELVLRFEPSNPAMTSWLYADGRLVTFRYGYRPAGAGDAYIGLVEQRLTPSGVEYLISQTMASGLFEDDLALRTEATGFLVVDVLNGDRLVQLALGHAMWGPEWAEAPEPNREQSLAMNALTDLLSSPESWPATAWENQTEATYVPSSFAICIRGVTASVDADRAWALLPEAAQDLRGIDTARPDPSMGGTAANCSRLATGDARALARILDASGSLGIQRQEPRLPGETWLRYAVADPDVAGNELWIAFCPILPGGQAVWLGPG